MIYVIAPGTGEMVSKNLLRRMRLPIRTGWDGWVHKDRQTGKVRKFRSYRSLIIHLKSPAH